MRKTSLVLAVLLAVAGICVVLWRRASSKNENWSSSNPNCWQTCKPITSASTPKSNPALLTSKPARSPPPT